jgi:hypothetical protein
VTSRPSASYAGLVSRLTGLTVDVAFLTVACLAVGGLPGLAWEQVLDRPTPGWLNWLSAAAAVVLPWAYFTASWWLIGRTIGGLVVGAVLRGHDDRDVGFLRSAVRALVGLLLVPVWLVGLVNVLLDGRRRAWHDILFRTVVRYAHQPKK